MLHQTSDCTYCGKRRTLLLGCCLLWLSLGRPAVADEARIPPRLTQQTPLRYPAEADGTAARITVRVTVGIDGLVSDVDVLDGPPVFYDEAIRAGYQLQFSPALRDGVPVESVSVIYFDFTPDPHMHEEPVGEMIIEAVSPDAYDTHARTTLSEEELEASAGEDLASTIADEAGVTTGGGTTSAAKPIIRGQSERRLLILFDGVRHESQKWGPDHAPEIDPFAAGEISIIKGAAGARYGPDAIGGVLLVNPPPMREEPGFSGKAVAATASNGRQGYGALRLDVAPEQTSHIAYRIEGNYARSASLSAPDYVLGNTASALYNIGAAAEYHHRTTEVCLSYQHHDYRAGIFYGTVAASPEDFLAQYEAGRPVTTELWTTTYTIDRASQDVTHDRAILHVTTAPGAWLLEASYAFQRNRRLEFEQVRDSIEGAQYDFTLRTHSLDFLASQPTYYVGERATLEGGVGLQGIFQENVYRGYSLLPNYRGMGGGVFGFQRLNLETGALSAGARLDGLSRTAFLADVDYDNHLDQDTLSADSCTILDTGVARCPARYTTGSVSLGGLWSAIPDLLELKLDLSSASRFPNADELYLIGYAPSFPVYALGAPDLGVETTWGASPTVGVRVGPLEAEISGYANYTQDYIYFAPILDGGGIPSYEVTILGTWPRYSYTAIDAVFTGTDGSLTLWPEAPVGLRLQGALVRAHDVASGDFLIGTPPDQVRATLTGRPPEAPRLAAPELSLIIDAVARQSRTDPVTDYVPAPDGYVLLGAAAQAELVLSGRSLRLGVEGVNLLNTAYRDYTSLLRYYADQPGRDIRVRAGTDF